MICLSTLRSLRKAVLEACKLIHAPPVQSAVDWADENFYLSPESSSVQGAWVTLPYQRAPLLAMTHDDIREFNWRKSARVGYTKLLCVATAYFIAHKRRNGVIYQPTDSDASDFVADEINTTLRDVPLMGELLMCHPEKITRYNTTSKKTFLGAILDIKGGKSARNYRRLTKDFVIYDELDGFDRDIEGEGSPLVLGDTRNETSSYPKSIRGSTPRIKGMSLIEESEGSAEMFFERYLPCPHCGHQQVLRWKNMKFDKEDPLNTARFECVSCPGEFHYNDYAAMDAGGVWMTPEGVLIDEEFGVFYREGERISPPRSIAFHIWSAYSYFSTWGDIADEFIFAKNEAKKGNLLRLKSFVNVRLGETWEEEGETADENVLKRHAEPYLSVVPEGVKVLTAAVDVQDDRFEIEICGWGVGEESWSIRYIQLYGNLARPEIWNILEEYLVDTYEGHDGTMFNISLTTIDSGGHFTSEVYEFCKRNYRQYIPIKGHNQPGQPIAKMPKEKSHLGVYLTMIGTDTAKSLIYARYKLSERGPGYCHYPVSEEYGDEYFQMATAEVKLKRYSKGVPYYEWVKENSNRNEALDCRVYNLAAIRLLQQHYGVRLNRVQVDNPVNAPAPKVRNDPIVEEPTPAQMINLERRKARRPARKKGFTNSWRK